MRVYSAQIPRAWLKRSKPSNILHRSSLTQRFERRSVFLVAGLAVAAILVAGAVAQDTRPGSPATPAVSTQQPTSSGTLASSRTSQDPTSVQQPQTEEGQFVFRKKVEEVVLHAVVVDRENHLISNLKQDAFSVYENGKPQRMTSFHHENVPLALGILIDNSGSMRPKRQSCPLEQRE